MNSRLIKNFFSKIIRFIKENRLIVILLLISIFFIVKFSEMPYIKFTPDIIEKIFEKPNQGTVWYEVCRLLENLSLAYVASIIFYIIIDYIPKQKMEIKAFNIIKSDLVSLYLYMSEIISSLNTALVLNKDIKDITLDDVKKLDEFKLRNEPVYYFTTSFINGENKGTGHGYFNYYIDTPKYTKLINDKLDKIKKMPCAINVEFKLLEVLSAIESNHFINQVLEFKNESLSNDICIVRMNFGKNYYDFIQSYIELDLFPFDKHTYHKIPMSESETKEYKDTVANILKTLTPEQKKTMKIFKGNKRIN